MTTEELGQACMDARPMVFRAVRNFRTLDREDIFQDACLRALSSSAKFDGRSQFSTWFVRVAINCALMQIRADRHHHPVCEVELELDPMSTADDPEEAAIRLERSDALLIAMAGLTLRQQQIAELRFSQEMTCKEVALELGIQTGAVKSQLHRKRGNGGVLARLRESLIA